MSELSRRDFLFRFSSKKDICAEESEGNWILVTQTKQLSLAGHITKIVGDENIEIYSVTEGIYALKNQSKWVAIKVDREGVVLINPALSWPEGQGLCHQSGQPIKITTHKETRL